MWINTVKKKNRCHCKVTPIISMDGIEGHKTHFLAISMHKGNNPRLTCVTGRGLTVTAMTDSSSFNWRAETCLSGMEWMNPYPKLMKQLPGPVWNQSQLRVKSKVKKNRQKSLIAKNATHVCWIKSLPLLPGWTEFVFKPLEAEILVLLK